MATSPSKRRSSDDPPGVAWPDSGSGFEADQFSPAGQLQQEWRLISALKSDPGVLRRAVGLNWFTKALAGLMVFIGLFIVVAAVIPW